MPFYFIRIITASRTDTAYDKEFNLANSSRGFGLREGLQLLQTDHSEDIRIHCDRLAIKHLRRRITMNTRDTASARTIIFFALIIALSSSITAQVKSSTESEILTGAASAKIVPTSFYFAGQSAPTQMRNTAVARLAKDRHIIAGLVDTSGYSTEISGKYEGFLITDSPVDIGGKRLETGSYGFGFSTDGKLHIFDLSSKEIMVVETVNDKEVKRPRPLMMSVAADGVRFYKGKNYALVAVK